jgi:signal transduction histidine kinase
VSRTFVDRWRRSAAADIVERVDAAVAHRIDVAQETPSERPSGRLLVVELWASGAFVAVAVGCAVAWGGDWPDWWVTGALVALLAVAFRVRFSVGAWDALPTQLVFVPMLFLVPVGWVPLLVAGSFLLARTPEYLSGARSPVRAVSVPADAWFAVGPTVVLGLADVTSPQWGDWPVLVAALAAQVGVDALATLVREWPLMEPGRRTISGRVSGWVYLVDVLLTPIGFLAAIASEQSPLAFLAVVPLGFMLVVFSREREGRIAAALEAARVSEQLVASERAAAREREELRAGASHELQTPLAVVVGLARTLQRDAGMAPERRAEAHAVLGREATRMSYLVRGFLDYTRLKARRGIDVRAQTVDIRDLVETVVDTIGPEAAIVAAVEPAKVRADRDRLALAIHNVLVNARQHGGGGTVRVSTRVAGGVELLIDDDGPGVAAEDRARVFDEFARGASAAGTEGAGLGLYVAREVLEAQGASIVVTDAPGGGARFVIALPSGS